MKFPAPRGAGSADPVRGLHGHVIEQLGMEIAAGRLGIDERINPEEIGARFGVSRTVVREAIRVLESKGMVVARPKTGTRVRPMAEWDLLDEQVILWRVKGPEHQEQLRELVLLRAGVEPIAARECCTYADDATLHDLERYCGDMEKAVTDQDQAGFTVADIGFHATLMSGSGNLIFSQISGAIEAVLRAREELDLMPESVEQETVAAHRRIFEAVADRDPDAAAERSRGLIDLAAAEILETLAKPRRRRR